MDVLHAAALAPTLLATCCALGGRAHRWGPVSAGSSLVSLVGDVAMLSAMADALFGFGMLPAFAWAGILLLLAIATGACARFGSTLHHECMLVHGILGLVLMAGMVAAMGSLGAAPLSPDGVAASGHSHGAAGLRLLLVVAGLAFALYSAVVAALLARRGDAVVGAGSVHSCTASARSNRLAAAQAASMGAAALLMAAGLA